MASLNAIKHLVETTLSVRIQALIPALIPVTDVTVNIPSSGDGLKTIRTGPGTNMSLKRLTGQSKVTKHGALI